MVGVVSLIPAGGDFISKFLEVKILPKCQICVDNETSNHCDIMMFVPFISFLIGRDPHGSWHNAGRRGLLEIGMRHDGPRHEGPPCALLSPHFLQFPFCEASLSGQPVIVQMFTKNTYYCVVIHLSRKILKAANLVTARIRRMGEGNVFSLFTSGGGGVSPAGGGVRSSWPGGSGQSGRGGSGQSSWGGGGQVQPVGGGQVSVARGGQVSLARGGSRPASRGGQVQLAGGGGQVQLAGREGSGPASGGGGSASCALLRAVCLLHSRRRTFLFLW